MGIYALFFNYIYKKNLILNMVGSIDLIKHFYAINEMSEIMMNFIRFRIINGF